MLQWVTDLALKDCFQHFADTNNKNQGDFADEYLDDSNLALPPFQTTYFDYDQTGEPKGMFMKRPRGRPRGSGKTPYSQELFDSIKGVQVGRGYIKCELCHKVIKETSIYTHRQTHLGIKNFGCEYCGKKFIQKGALTTHRRLHTGEKPYTCLRCGRSFTAHSGLLQHKCPNKPKRDRQDNSEPNLDLLNQTM